MYERRERVYWSRASVVDDDDYYYYYHDDEENKKMDLIITTRLVLARVLIAGQYQRASERWESGDLLAARRLL